MATAARIEPLDLDVGRSDIWRENRWEPLMDRLRAEAPVSYCPDGAYGAYWSVVSYDDITEVEAHPELYSSASEYGGITIADALGEAELPHFIAMDRPRHTGQRRSVQPAFTPSEIERLSHEIRRAIGASVVTEEQFIVLPKAPIQRLGQRSGGCGDDAAFIVHWDTDRNLHASPPFL